MSCMYLESALARLLSANTGIMVTYFLFPDLSLWVTGRGFAYNCLWGGGWQFRDLRFAEFKIFLAKFMASVRRGHGEQ